MDRRTYERLFSPAFQRMMPYEPEHPRERAQRERVEHQFAHTGGHDANYRDTPNTRDPQR